MCTAYIETCFTVCDLTLEPVKKDESHQRLYEYLSEYLLKCTICGIAEVIQCKIESLWNGTLESW